jgi:hypothetical protein
MVKRWFSYDEGQKPTCAMGYQRDQLVHRGRVRNCAVPVEGWQNRGPSLKFIENLRHRCASFLWSHSLLPMTKNSPTPISNGYVMVGLQGLGKYNCSSSLRYF